MESAKIRQWLKAKLAAEAGVTALVGTRIYPVVIPQEPTYPCVAYSTQIANATVMKEAGMIDLCTIQFSIVSPKLEDCEAVENALRDVFDYMGTETASGFTVQASEFVGSRDMMVERIEFPVIEVTYRFRMYR